MTDDDAYDGEPVEVPIDGTLDLHTFRPRDVADVVATYLDECRARGILGVRVIHGKGVGVQRRIVEGVLQRHPAVLSFRTADSGAGGWGATLIQLRPGPEAALP
jgi:DNA-nicking Smr family endonuclease